MNALVLGEKVNARDLSEKVNARGLREKVNAQGLPDTDSPSTSWCHRLFSGCHSQMRKLLQIDKHQQLKMECSPPVAAERNKVLQLLN